MNFQRGAPWGVDLRKEHFSCTALCLAYQFCIRIQLPTDIKTRSHSSSKLLQGVCTLQATSFKKTKKNSTFPKIKTKLQAPGGLAEWFWFVLMLWKARGRSHFQEKEQTITSSSNPHPPHSRAYDREHGSVNSSMVFEWLGAYAAQQALH